MTEALTGRRAALGAGLGALVMALLLAAPGDSLAKKKSKKPQRKPNIVMVMTDDQTAEQQRFLPETNRLIGDRGVTFANNFVTYSLCCPSRSTWLTGQYAHNHGVRGNSPPSGGFGKLYPTVGNTLPVWLQRAGYATAHIGKFLNGYGKATFDSYVPPGWSEWYGALDDPDAYTGGTYTMYGYTLNENGSIVHYGSTPDIVDPVTYQTDVYSAKAADFINRRAPSRKPFFLSVAPLASHSEGAGATPGNNPRAAPRHEGAFSGITFPTPPNFNEADVSDKPQSIRNLAPMTLAQQLAAADRYRARAESLLAVDDLVQNLSATLKAKGELKNTVLIFTSDNGFFHGEHRVRNGKVRLYEESIRVPLQIAGPGVPKNGTRNQLVANVDLAPTILDFAGAKPGRLGDGTSLLPLMQNKLKRLGRAIGIEAFFTADTDDDPEAPPTNFQAVRTDRYLYAEYGTAEAELYDLESDPFELNNRAADPSLARVRTSLDRLLAQTAFCKGGGCRARPRVKLRLQAKNGCASLRGVIAGPQRDEALEAAFRVGGRRAGAVKAPPLKKSLPRRGAEASATVTMLDGRVVSLKRKLPTACWFPR